MNFTNVPPHIEDALAKLGQAPSRRTLLKSAGLFAISFAAMGPGPLARQAKAQAPAGAAGPYPDPDFRQVDSWIAIHADNSATFSVGKTDCGQGTGTSFRQIMSDELDVAFEKTTCIMGSTDVTVDQGGSGGSTAMERDSWPMRRVAAEGRRVLLEMGSAHLGVPVDRLTVSEGVITVKGDPSKTVTYGELIGGKRFNVTVTGNNINVIRGKAPLKVLQEYKNIGQTPQRADIPAKVDGTMQWATGVKLPGMVHARNVKPSMAGAKLVSIDESSVRNLPGFIRVVSKGNYVAVVCEREEQAINAAKKLVVHWEKPARPPFPSSENLFNYMREVTPTSSTKPVIVGNLETAFKEAAMVIEADYDIPFQGHTSFSPAHALADPSNDQMTIYSNDMKSYGMRRGVAEFLGIPREKVRVVWMEGPQGFGRTAAEDAGAEAAYLAKEIGRPVRMQWMRNEETAWDTKAPAFAVKVRGALDAAGNLIALDYDARSADYNHVGYNEADTVLIAQLMGIRRETPAAGSASLPGEVYAIPHRRMGMHVVSLPLIWETPLRTGNLRDPNGPQSTFAAESFIDELAVAAKADPYEFRMKLLTSGTGDDANFKRARSIAALKAAAETYGWDRRPSPKRVGNGEILTGRGIAYAFRGQTIAAEIAEVEVNRRTGHVWVKRLVCAHDCGLMINPQSLRHTVECAMLHSVSRALHEEVQFDTEKVTSVDWISHPTLTNADTPERLDVVLINGDPNPNRPDLAPYGAGEAACKPMLAAIANAIHDATGVRLRRVPFRAPRVLAALKAAQV
jgi:CO/xanthine dehydrogenase Mo-binding subunit